MTPRAPVRKFFSQWAARWRQRISRVIEKRRVAFKENITQRKISKMAHQIERIQETSHTSLERLQKIHKIFYGTDTRIMENPATMRLWAELFHAQLEFLEDPSYSLAKKLHGIGENDIGTYLQFELDKIGNFKQVAYELSERNLSSRRRRALEQTAHSLLADAKYLIVAELGKLP